MCSISTNILTVLANFLGIQNSIFSKNVGRDHGNISHWGRIQSIVATEAGCHSNPNREKSPCGAAAYLGIVGWGTVSRPARWSKVKAREPRDKLQEVSCTVKVKWRIYWIEMLKSKKICAIKISNLLMYLEGLSTKVARIEGVRIALASGARGGVLDYCISPSTMCSCFGPVMRPHITYTHNEPCATLARHFATIWDDSRSRTTKDDKGRHTLRPFVMSYTILQYSTVLPFTFATFSNLFWRF